MSEPGLKDGNLWRVRDSQNGYEQYTYDEKNHCARRKPQECCYGTVGIDISVGRNWSV